MKLFLKDQRPLFSFYILQLLTVSGVYWLDGYRNIAMVLYAALLSGCLLAVYLVFRYMSNRSFYRCLEQGKGWMPLRKCRLRHRYPNTCTGY